MDAEPLPEDIASLVVLHAKLVLKQHRGEGDAETENQRVLVWEALMDAWDAMDED